MVRQKKEERKKEGRKGFNSKKKKTSLFNISL